MKYEKLLHEAILEGISVDENYPFQSKLKGLYMDGNIALADSLDTSAEKTCVLSEELGHYHTSAGNIIDQSCSENRKQELRARLWAYDKLVGLSGIIQAHHEGCSNLHEMADFLDVTEQFLKEALLCYRNKYGICTQIGCYVIYFEPSIGILDLTE